MLNGGRIGGDSKGTMPVESRVRNGLRESRLMAPRTDSLSSAPTAPPVRSSTPLGTTRTPWRDAYALSRSAWIRGRSIETGAPSMEAISNVLQAMLGEDEGQ